MLASVASMKQLNANMTEEMVIERFRPNIVVSGCLSHGEVGLCKLLLMGEELGEELGEGGLAIHVRLDYELM